MGQSDAAEDIAIGAPVNEIAVGWFDVCVLTDAGGVKCWGQNLNGETGTGGPIAIHGEAVGTPTDVVGLTSGVAHIVMGYAHACAMMVDGRIMCWGSVTGDGTGNPSSVPVEVVGF